MTPDAETIALLVLLIKLISWIYTILVAAAATEGEREAVAMSCKGERQSKSSWGRQDEDCEGERQNPTTVCRHPTSFRRGRTMSLERVHDVRVSLRAHCKHAWHLEWRHSIEIQCVTTALCKPMFSQGISCPAVEPLVTNRWNWSQHFCLWAVLNKNNMIGINAVLRHIAPFLHAIKETWLCSWTTRINFGEMLSPLLRWYITCSSCSIKQVSSILIWLLFAGFPVHLACTKKGWTALKVEKSGARIQEYTWQRKGKKAVKRISYLVW